jgi:hypothetical protein
MILLQSVSPQTPSLVTQGALDFFAAVGIFGTITSLALAVVAIWLAVQHKRDADKVNADTSNLLADIRSETKAISQGVMAELRAYGESMRGTFTANHMTTPSTVPIKPPSDIEYRNDPATNGGVR